MDAGIIHEPLVKERHNNRRRRAAGASRRLREYRAGSEGQKLSGNVVSEWLRWCDGYPGVVRAVSVAHSKQLVERFIAAGLRAAHLDGETPLAERSRILARLAIGGR